MTLLSAWNMKTQMDMKKIDTAIKFFQSLSDNEGAERCVTTLAAQGKVKTESAV